jgi:diguanylate cyclase
MMTPIDRMDQPTGHTIPVVRRAAAAAWAALDEYRILPTPRAYEVLFAHFSGANPAVSHCLRPHLDEGRPLRSEHLEEMYDTCLRRPLGPEEPAGAGARMPDEAAKRLPVSFRQRRRSFRDHGSPLAHGSAHIEHGTTVDGSLQAVRVLTSETARASEPARSLEQQLATATALIGRLRDELSAARRETEVDPLTGISNRRAFERELRRAVYQAATGDPRPFSLLMVDVDHFKDFNDQHGHRIGDDVLRVVGRLLFDNVDGRHLVARYGGEEFAVLLADADLPAAAALAEQIRSRLGRRRLFKRGSGERIGRITVSIGVVEHRPEESGASLVERADQGLYAAKRTGRNRVCEGP